MRKILEFRLPEDRVEAYVAEFAHVWRNALHDLDIWLSVQERDGEAWAADVRRKIRQLVAPHDLYDGRGEIVA